MQLIKYFYNYDGQGAPGFLDEQEVQGKIIDYTYTWPQKANVVLGGVQWAQGLPYALLLTPARWTLDTDTAVAREVMTIVIYYLLPQPQLDFDASANERLIDLCMAAAADMIDRVRHDSRCHLTATTCSGVSVYDVDNRNLTGVRLELTLRDNAGYCIQTHRPQCN